MFSRDEMQRAIEDALKTMEGVALELYRRGREPLLEELEDCRARSADLCTMLEQVTRERDEARAEVEHAYREGGALYEAKIAEREAYRSGAEAMREACAQWVDHWVSGHVADKLRDMPTPEEP